MPKRSYFAERIPFRYLPVPWPVAEQWLAHLTHGELKVYIAILIEARKQKNCLKATVGIPAIETITGMTRRGVQLVIPKLEARGLVFVIRRRNRPSVYELKTNWADLDLPRTPVRTKPTSTANPSSPRGANPGSPNILDIREREDGKLPVQ